MARVEVLLVGVLLVLALLLGVLFGGSSIWFLKPESNAGGPLVEKTVNNYVCMDGSIKSNQADCPTTINTGNGETLTCPICKVTPVSDSSTKRCGCQECAAQCGAILPAITSTTLAPCKPCSANSDCGQSSYGQPKCKNDQTYKMFSEPFCETEKDGRKCCSAKETQTGMTQCASAERCRNGQGCMPYQDATDE